MERALPVNRTMGPAYDNYTNEHQLEEDGLCGLSPFIPYPSIRRVRIQALSHIVKAWRYYYRFSRDSFTYMKEFFNDRTSACNRKL
jgi:hypothetical protein